MWRPVDKLLCRVQEQWPHEGLTLKIARRLFPVHLSTRGVGWSLQCKPQIQLRGRLRGGTQTSITAETMGQRPSRQAHTDPSGHPSLQGGAQASLHRYRRQQTTSLGSH